MSSIRQSTDSANVGFENDFNGSLGYSAAGYDYSQQAVPHFGPSSIAGGPTQQLVPDPRAFAAYNRIPTTFDQMGQDAADVTSYGEDAGQDITAITGQSELRQSDTLGQATKQTLSIQEVPSALEVEEKSKKRIRKPAKPSGNESDDETSRKKHRGRPRLHPQEENAAEVSDPSPWVGSGPLTKRVETPNTDQDGPESLSNAQGNHHLEVDEAVF